MTDNSSDSSDKIPSDKDPRIDKSRASDDQMQEVHATLLREKEEPTEGYSPVPIALIFLFSALTFWGGVYIAEYSGGFQALVYDETQDVTEEEEDTGPPDITVVGQRVYTRNCVACHQRDGQGQGQAFPTLVGTDWVLGSEERLVRVLLHGLRGEIEVLGQTFNGVMPGFGPDVGGNLDDEQIAGVLSYIRNEWGNEAPYVEIETVARIREEEAGRSTAWTAEELEPFVEAEAEPEEEEADEAEESEEAPEETETENDEEPEPEEANQDTE